MARPSTFTIEFEFTPGTWTDVTAYHLFTEATTIRRGRNSVLDVAQIGTCSFTLSNNDGRFTPAGTSPYYPNIRPNVRVRVTVAGYARFTGFVDSWTPHYPMSTQDEPRVEVAATDALRILSRHKLHSTYVESAKAWMPAASVWMWDVTAGESCPDLLGVAGPMVKHTPKPSQITASSGSVAYAETGPPRVGSGIKLIPGATVNLPAHYGTQLTDDSAGHVLTLPVPAQLDSDSAWSIGFWFNLTATYDQRTGVAPYTGEYVSTLLATDNGQGFQVVIDGSTTTSGYVRVSDYSGAWFANSLSEVIFSPGWNFFGMSFDGTRATVYINGDQVATGLFSYGYTLPTTVSIGGWYSKMFNRTWRAPAMTVAGVVYSPTSTVQTVWAQLYQAAMGYPEFWFTNPGFSGDDAGGRITRLMAMAGVEYGTGYLADNGSAVMDALDTEGKDVVSLAQEAAKAEMGVFYVRGDGVVRFLDRYRRAYTSVADGYFEQEKDTTGSEYSAALEDAQVVNTLTVTATGDGSEFTAVDSYSVAQNGTITASESLAVTDGVQAADWASWNVAALSRPSPRISTVTVDLLTAQSAGVYDTTLALDIGSLVTVWGLPTVSQQATSFDGYVEGITETWSLDECLVTFDTSPVTPHNFTLDVGNLDWLDTNGEGLTAAVNASATSLAVSASPGFFNGTYDIELGTERMTVTAATAAAATRTNYITQPSFETWPYTYWAFTGSDGESRQAPGRGLFGGNGGIFMWGTGVPVGKLRATIAGLSIGVTYTLSAYVWVPSGQRSVSAWVQTVGNGAESTLFNTWQRVSYTFVATSTTTQYCGLITTNGTGVAGAGEWLWVDGFQLEQGTVATPYFDGSTPGGAWTGTAHASTSTGSTQTLTVTRGVGGTTAYAHSGGELILTARTLALGY